MCSRVTFSHSLFGLILLAACGGKTESNIEATDPVESVNTLLQKETQIQKSDAEVEIIEQKESLTETEMGNVCRAAIAKLMGRDISIIHVDKIDLITIYVSYQRPSDNKTWKNSCIIKDNIVIWNSVDLDGPNTGPGRWRNGPYDSVVTYKLDENGSITITERHTDGSGSSDEFAVD